MSTPRDPSETFIGMKMDTDPFALLGLPHAYADESVVLSALGARMSEIADHRRSQTPEANEMRLALHAAAAQLLDPQLQELLLHAQSTPISESQPVEKQQNTKSEEPPPQPQSNPIADHITHDLLLVVASNGGWNKTAMRRIAMLAHARGIPSSELPSVVAGVLTLGAIAQPLPAKPVVSVSPERTGSIAATRSRSSRRTSRTGGLIVTGIFAVLTIVSLLLVWERLTQKQTDPVTNQSEQAAQTESPELPESSTVADTTKPLTPTQTMSISDAAHQLTAIASSRSALDQEQLRTLARIHTTVAAKWTQLDNDVLVSIHNSILEIVYFNSSNTDNVLEYLNIISTDSHLDPFSKQEIVSASWAIGTLARLSIERNLPTAVDAAIIGHLAAIPAGAALGSAKGFDEGVLSALDMFTAQMTEQEVPVSAWQGWLDVLDAAAPDDQRLRLEYRLTAIETLAVLGSEPTQSRRVFEAIELLAGGIVLESKGIASRKLIDWLGDDRVSPADLSVITRVIISKSRTSGVDESLVLSSSADPARRMAVRTELEELLLGIDAGSTDAINQWMAIADQELHKQSQSSAKMLLLRATARSRLSSAARATFWGDYQASQHTLANITDDLDQIVSAGTSTSPKHLGGDGSLSWATRYISARRNIPIRQVLLAELTRGRRVLGPVAAEALVKDAFFGTPATVRAQAREVVRIHAQSPAVVNAVLEYLPRIPKIDSSSDVIESLVYGNLPAASDPRWSLKARQLLTETLLYLVSGQGDGEAIDSLVAELAASYQTRLAAATQGHALAPAEYLQEASLRLYEQWVSTARAQINDMQFITRLDEIEMKRIGRTTLADGIIVGFAANQVSAVEAMAVVVEAEHSDRADEIYRIISTMSEERRQASNILEQINIVEHAAVELWRIRLGGGTK